jgi:hypothetical protein
VETTEQKGARRKIPLIKQEKGKGNMPESAGQDSIQQHQHNPPNKHQEDGNPLFHEEPLLKE